MTPKTSFLGSLQSTKPTYGGLFSNLKAPAISLFGKKPAPTPATVPTPLVANSPSSTAPTPTKVTAPVKTTTPAKTAYTASLGGASTPGASTGGSTPVPAQTPPADTTKTTSYLDSYRDYLSQYAASLKPSDEVKAASTKLAEISGKIDERSLKARREYESTLDTPGMLKSGASEAATQGMRRNDANLADLAVQQSGASRMYEALSGNAKGNSDSLKAMAEVSKPIQIGDSYIDPKTGQIVYEKPKDTAFSLSEGQARYEINPKTGKYEKIASVGKTYAPGTGGGGGGISGPGGTYTVGTNPTVDAWAQRIQEGSAKITDIPAAQSGLRSAVTVALSAMGNSGEGKPTTTELGKSALATANDLRAKFTGGRGKSVVGASRLFGGALAGITPGSDAFNFKNDFNALKSQLSLEGVKYLKGQGAVSDAERALLAQAVSKLNLGQSEGEFKRTLETIITKLTGGGIVGTESATSLPPQMELPDGTVVNLQADGTYE